MLRIYRYFRNVIPRPLQTCAEAEGGIIGRSGAERCDSQRADRRRCQFVDAKDCVLDRPFFASCQERLGVGLNMISALWSAFVQRHASINDRHLLAVATVAHDTLRGAFLFILPHDVKAQA